MERLTEPQACCLKAIDRYRRRSGQAPTRRELATLLQQKSTNGVNQILDALSKKGYVKIRPPRRRRNIVVLCTPEGISRERRTAAASK